jgi:hypothetical protein
VITLAFFMRFGHGARAPRLRIVICVRLPAELVGLRKPVAIQSDSRHPACSLLSVATL